MRRARHNIDLLVPRLKEIGYHFGTLGYENSGQWYGDFRPIHEPPAADVSEQLNSLKGRYGMFPLSLRAWYEVVGGVNSLGFHPDWPDPKTLDPLCVMPLEGIAAELHEAHRDGLDEDAPPRVAVSPDEYHKADISGGPSYAVEFPCPGADGEMLNEWHGTTFVNYLRSTFGWGGFPGFQRCQPDRRWSKHMEIIVGGLLPL